MKHIYVVKGMHCQGCREKVETSLNEIPGISASVSLDPPQAEITMEKHVPTETLQQALSAVGNYSIKLPGDFAHHEHTSHHEHRGGHSHAETEAKHRHVGSGIYYCPMHCEGEKTYNQPGNCPVCGMDLVPLAVNEDEGNKTYADLLYKFKIAAAFTLP